MELSYHNRYRDLFWYNLYQLPRTRVYQIAFGLYLLFMGYIAFDIMQTSPSTFIMKIISIVIIVTGFLLVLVVAQFVFICLHLVFSQHYRQLVQTETKISVSDSGLVEDAATGHLEVKWSGIKNIVQSGDYILICISDMAACIVPKRAFTDETESNRFFIYTYQHWNDARSKSL